MTGADRTRGRSRGAGGTGRKGDSGGTDLWAGVRNARVGVKDTVVAECGTGAGA